MAASEAPTTPAQTFEAGYEQYKQFSERVMDAARKTGVQTIDAYQKAVERTLEMERKLGVATKQDWLKGMIDSHADMTHELTGAYTSAVRSLLS